MQEDVTRDGTDISLNVDVEAGDCRPLARVIWRKDR